MRRVRIPSRHLRTTQIRYWGKGGYVDGKWEDRLIRTVNVRATIQPISGTEIQRLPEGVNPSDVISVKFNAQNVDLDTESRRPPEIAYNGRWYALLSASDWRHRGIVEALFKDPKYDARTA